MTAAPASEARPLLVLVGGAPAAGKSTLATKLAAALSLPLVPRDPITEELAEAFGVLAHPEMRRPVLSASFRVFYRLVREALRTSGGAVAETNFHRGVSEADLRPLVAEGAAVFVFCRTDRETSIRRFVERHERRERHWSSFDADRIAALRVGQPQEAWERAQPPDLDVPLLEVDTTDGYRPDLEAVVAFVRALGEGTRVPRTA